MTNGLDYDIVFVSVKLGISTLHTNQYRDSDRLQQIQMLMLSGF